MIDVEWSKSEEKAYDVTIEIYANDRTGILADIITAANSIKTKLIAINARTTKEKIVIAEVTVEVENIEELNKVLKTLRKVDSVYEVKRKK